MCCYFQKGTQDNVAFVFSCPGKLEQIQNKPAAGVTGNNLRILLELLSQLLRRDDLTRKDITISNAWNMVEYINGTARTEAADNEILECENIKRLSSELNHITDVIVCCGYKAKLAITSCKLKVDVICTRHLGMVALNHIYYDLNGDRIERANGNRKQGSLNTRKRLEVVAADLVEQYHKIINSKVKTR